MKKKWPFGTSRLWGEVEPWNWLRHITPWWFLQMLFDHYHICWSGMVMWKMGYGLDWSISRGCLYPYDYCGFYDHATQEEREEALRIIGESPVIVFKWSERCN